MTPAQPSLWRRILTQPGVWGVAGFVVHMIWFFTAIAVFTGSDLGLHDWVTAWVENNRPDLGGPAYMHAFGYIGNALLIVFGCALACNVVAIIFAVKQHRVEFRMKRGLCPKCAYDLRGTDSNTCPECGALAIATSRGSP